MAVIKEKVGDESPVKEEKKHLTSWEKDFRLAPLGTTGFVFDEYLEMGKLDQDRVLMVLSNCLSIRAGIKQEKLYVVV